MTRLAFWKMTGAGNDFIVLDARGGLPAAPDDLARRLCPRRVAIGADGLMAVGPADGGAIAVDYVNADGSAADFCGNGARCAALFAARNGLAQGEARLLFPGRTVTARVGDDAVQIEVDRPAVLGRIEWALDDGTVVRGARIDAGVHHVVLPDAPGRDLDAVRSGLDAAHPDVSAAANVTLVQRLASGLLGVRTHERGAGETLACGSGALAVVALEPGADAGLARTVVPPAGIPLEVELTPAPGPARLTGEARVVYRGSVLVA